MTAEGGGGRRRTGGTLGRAAGDRREWSRAAMKSGYRGLTMLA